MRSPKAPLASRVVAVLAWALALVLAGTVTSWAVTAIAGAEGPARDRVLAESDVTAALAGQRAVAGATRTPTSTSGAAAAPAPTPVPVPVPVPQLSSAAVVPAAPPATPPEGPSAAPPLSTPDVYRIWSVAGGRVGAKCRGAALSDVYFTPADGWTMEVQHNASDGLEVTFRRTPAETSVHVACVAGVPTTQTSNGD